VKEKVRKQRPSEAEYALALAISRDEQEKLKQFLRKQLRKYGKPMSLEEVRAILDNKLGQTSLSDLIIAARKERL